MPWLHKVPAMISALAFGYGVGMATPESTLHDVRAAVHAYRGARNAPHEWAGRGPTAPYPQSAYPEYAYGQREAGRAPTGAVNGLGYRESRELQRLRETAPANGQSCRLHPTHSEPPSYASTYPDNEDGIGEDPDDLDPAAQEALTRLQLPDFRVAVTRRALKYVRFLTRTDRGRGLFESWLKRSGRYQELVQQSLREWQLPEDLIWVAMIESGFDPKARSPAGAVGLWQFMQGTGEVYGLHVTRDVDARMNPIEATRAAAHHLRDLHQRFGSWDLALAAYNMGYEQLLDRIDRYGTTDFNELSRQQALPGETAAYVPKIVAAALVANNLERYGFEDAKLSAPIHHSELSVPGGTKLSVLARAAGVSTATIHRYNPHLRKEHVPHGRDFTVYVPAGSLSRARAALPAMLDERGGRDDVDVLEPDEMLGLGGAKGKRSRYDGWNDEENLLSLLPKPKRRSMRSVLKGQRDADEDPVAALAEDFLPSRTDREIVMYRVGPGDTLIGVAKQFAIDIDDLAYDNGLDPDTRLQEGALLKLSVKRDVVERWKRDAGKEAPREKKQRSAPKDKG
jgi:membrane-bound lytic murein transglycosylase D